MDGLGLHDACVHAELGMRIPIIEADVIYS